MLIDAELLRWLKSLFAHAGQCAAWNCPLCDSAQAIRTQLSDRLFRTLLYPENMLARKPSQ